ncbi:hypothetical protein ACIQGZ_04295 [Streptomyces sp. NPDC092296]|uniref:hypothetical protein n=1 Tax=Streptomyces sp. NPDC092296 TaxID=3366012 RepID=UPI0037F151B5
MAAFDEELLLQLAAARRELADARRAGDDDGVQAYRGRIRGLLRLADLHGVKLPATDGEADEEG